MQGNWGAVEFTDLDTLLPAMIAVGRLPDGGLRIFVDQNTSPEGGWGGDCDVGFDREGALRLDRLLGESHKVGESGPVAGWEPVDSASYSWCDQDQEPGQDQGMILFLARRGVVRMSVQSRNSKWPPYDLTMPIDALERLIKLGKSVV